MLYKEQAALNLRSGISSQPVYHVRGFHPALFKRNVLALASPHEEPTMPGAFDRRAMILSTASSVVFLFRGLSAQAQVDDEPQDTSATVLVVGSTGQTGRRVVQELRSRGFSVKAGVRDIKKGQALGLSLDQGVQLVEADVLKPDSLTTALKGVGAVICATGYTGFNPSGFGDVDEIGTKNLIDAANRAGVKHFVLLSSLLTNAPSVGQAENPNYKFLNIFGAVLDHKLVAEKYLRGSGMTWTIVRPGGLSNDPPAKVGNLVVGKEDSLFGLDNDPGREISRDTVADVLASALQQPSARNKVVEVVAALKAPVLGEESWFP